ncbi:adenylate kinase family protein [Candidatus Azoamicus ciliaticola]|uniref:Adenylate kinase n=1 Tax=Candidatus Azoamicus ciliaticola TaxID=2652803 RepID=A0A6J5JWC5_9GAMM|nr:nucleoside monophosphate kinase [Candidatus Azoamicus ciliaticola]CAB3976324.1 Adenylate kinase [Candidatus Azoamicus ciliaticola]
MKIILLGAPGSGKGTQAELIKKKLNLHHISTGELIRKELDSNQEIKKIVKKGKLLDDEIILKFIEKNIKKINDILFDGFPRTLNQAISLTKKNIKIDYIIQIEIDEKNIIKRLKYRLTNKNKNYNIINIKQKIKNKDDLTGENLKKRNDDKIKIIKKRLLDHNTNTTEILNWYTNINTHLIKINGNNNVDDIFEKIINNIKFYEKNI